MAAAPGAGPDLGPRRTASSSRATAPTCPTCSGAIDVLALPSLYEGTPLALFEAMAAGKAIVSSAVDGCAEVLEHERTGAPRAPGQRRTPWPRPSSSLLGDATKRRALAEAARGRVAQVRHRGLRGARCRTSTTRSWPSEDAVPLRQLARQARRGPGGPARPAARPLPRFVTGGPLPKGDVPVFVFHSVEPESFGRKLRYLADNGYVTLSVDEYYQGLLGAPALPRAGRAPHLRRRPRQPLERGRSPAAPLRHARRGLPGAGPHAVASGPPGSRSSTTSRRGAQRPEEVLDRESGDGAFLSWEEVSALARVRSLRLREPHPHPRAHPRRAASSPASSPRASRRGYAAMDVPLVAEGGRDLLAAEVPLGTPLLRSAPRTSEELRFFEEPGLPRAPAWRPSPPAGGEAFFRRSRLGEAPADAWRRPRARAGPLGVARRARGRAPARACASRGA